MSKIFINNGYNVLGLNGGYKSLFSDEPAFEYLDFDYADQIYSRGGSALKMSRYKPKDDEFKVDFFKKNTESGAGGSCPSNYHRQGGLQT